MKTYLIVGVVFAALCVGVGAYFYTAGNTGLFGICILAAVLCFWPSYRKYRELKRGSSREKERDKTDEDKK